MDDLKIPQNVIDAVRTHGFAKLAAKMYGVEEINEKTAVEIIANRFMQRRQEWHEVTAGLKALEDLLG